MLTFMIYLMSISTKIIHLTGILGSLSMVFGGVAYASGYTEDSQKMKRAGKSLCKVGACLLIISCLLPDNKTIALMIAVPEVVEIVKSDEVKELGEETVETMKYFLKQVRSESITQEKEE